MGRFAEWLALQNEASAAATDLADFVHRFEDVIRLGKVRRIDRSSIELDHGSISTDPAHVHIDCTAAGLGVKGDRPVFEDGRITLQWVQAGIAPFSAALIGFVEARRDDDTDRNRLCPPNGYTAAADARNLARGWAITQRAVSAWMAEPDVNGWLSTCRLSALGNAGEHLSEPDTMGALIRMMTTQEAAIENLERILAEDAVPA